MLAQARMFVYIPINAIERIVRFVRRSLHDEVAYVCCIWLFFLAVLCGGVHGSMSPSTRHGRRSKAARALKRIRAAERGFFPPANKTQIIDVQLTVHEPDEMRLCRTTCYIHRHNRHLLYTLCSSISC